MTVVFMIVLTLYAFLFFVSRDRYRDIVSSLDKKSYPLKDLMPVPLFLFEKADYKYNTGYDQNLQLKLGELYGNKDGRFRLQMHWANKTALLMVVILIILIVGAAMDGADSGYAVFSAAVLGLVFYLVDNEISVKVRKRRLMIQLDFPDFLNRLVLLINAGMTVVRAIDKIAAENFEGSCRAGRPLYEELRTTLLEIKADKPELKAYEDFAKRCRIPEITKFTSVVIQNIRKGNAELVSILRLQASESWEMRKNVAKKLGEEASTKLLFPMMIMFIAILMIVIAPSIMQLQGF